MTVKEAGHSIAETESVTPWSRKLYHNANADEFWNESDGLHYAYLIYRTLRGDFDQFKPDAVFYVGKSPAAYLKKVGSPEIPEDKVRDWQRFLWNQTVVPMLIVQSKTEVHVYTACTPPKKSDSQERITSILEDVANALDLDQLLTAIEAGTIYKEYPEAFCKSCTVDRFLLDNLNVAAVQLAETQKGGAGNQENLEFVHQFLTRLLFVCYLIERGMIKGEHFEDDALRKLHPRTEKQKGYFLCHLFDDLATYPKRRDALCHLFARVKDRFNGSLFPENGVKGEKDRYNEGFISILHRFLKSQELQKGQLTLGFWAYDFSVIPIETISAVYESFLGTQGKIRESFGEDDTKRTAGAYYTPLHLAELTVDIALENNKKPIHELKVLDPACGSGVFLVSLFGRMAESLRRQNNYPLNSVDNKCALDLQKLHENLYGIDVNPTACHITCFSLYLALLEHLLPKDVEYLCELNESKKALRPLLASHPKGYNTVYHDNLFNPELSLKKTDFDIVIGNPPWVSRGKQKDEAFLDWQKTNPNILGPDRQIAHGFMWKVLDRLSGEGIACLLLPSAVLFNDHTNQFQKEWFSSVTVERVVNFSDLRFLLFEDAIHPCVAIRFKERKPDLKHFIYYESPKTDARSQCGSPVFMREEDTVKLVLRNILYAAQNKQAPMIWKTHFWGSWREQRLLARLNDLSKLNTIAGEIEEKKRWIKGQGIQVTGGDNNPVWWKPSTLFLDSNENIDLVISPNGLPTVRQAGIPCDTAHRPRIKQLFVGPKVLISQGSKNMKVAYCDFAVVFRSALQSISGKKKDARYLRFLSAVVKSDVSQYYLFHTSANWAIERDKSLFYEILSLPFFLPENSSDARKAEKIITEVSNVIESFERKIKTKGWLDWNDESMRIRQDKLEPLIREYYDIDKYEAMLIDDTREFAMESFHPRYNTKNIPTLREADQNDQKVYAETLCEMLNNFGEGSNFKVNGEVIQGNPYSVVQVSLVDKIHKSISVVKADERLVKIFKRMEVLLEQKEGRFVFCKNLKVFDGNDLYVLKPMQMRFWTRTAALNDADEIAGALLKS